MKTLLITLEFPPTNGGVANYYYNLVKNWPISENISVINNHKEELAKKQGFFSWYPAFGTLWRKLNRNDIDYLLVGQILPLGTVSYILSFFKPIKYAIFFHGMDLSYTLKSIRKKIISRLILNRADKIICANSYVAQKINEYYPGLENKINIVNPGVISDIPVFSENDISEIKKYYNTEGKTILFTLARLVKRKGIDMTIKTLNEMTEEEIKNLVYFVAGAGKDEAYIKNMVPSNLLDKIVFLGTLDENKKWLWLNICDIFIMPSRDIDGDFEGFGIVYLEANLSNSPVIAGKAGGVKDAVTDGFNGLLVDPTNTNEIKEAIIKLNNDLDFRQKLGRQGEETVKINYNWEKQAAKIVNIIK